MTKSFHSRTKFLILGGFWLSSAAFSEEGFNLFGGEAPTTESPAVPRPPVKMPKSSAPEVPSAGTSATKVDRVGGEPALRAGFRYIRHQKTADTTKSSAVNTPPPPGPGLPFPSMPTTSSENVQKGNITLTQMIFDGYISFLSKGRQFGAIDFEIPMRQLTSDYSGRNSGSEIGGMDMMLVAGERDVGSFGVGAQAIQSPTLKLVEKNQRARGFFYLERGGMSSAKRGSRFLVQLGPELSYPFKNSQSKIQYDPLYGGKVLLGYSTSALLDSPFRFKVSGNYFRVNRFIENKISYEGGGLLAASASLDFNVAGDLWLGIEAQRALAKPQGREYIFGNPELPALYGNSYGLYVQASAF